MQVGDLVQVTNKGNLYSTYESYFKRLCPEYLDGYRMAMREYKLQRGDLAQVLFVHGHTTFPEVELCVIEPAAYPGQYYLIGAEGLQNIIDHYGMKIDIEDIFFKNDEIDVSSEELMKLFG